jgi:HPt (histidine-containing phosphotransfer) domain-containing protein
MNMLTESECPPTTAVIDRTVVLDRVGGDIGLLREIVAIFLAEYPTLLAEIRESVATADAQKLERAAHSLKGAVANFAVHTATQAAYRLETIGRSSNLDAAPEALATLEAQLAAIRPALTQLVDG